MTCRGLIRACEACAFRFCCEKRRSAMTVRLLQKRRPRFVFIVTFCQGARMTTQIGPYRTKAEARYFTKRSPVYGSTYDITAYFDVESYFGIKQLRSSQRRSERSPDASSTS